jgi:RNA 2',3'-cyclic 3'-phosphodiesterase
MSESLSPVRLFIGIHCSGLPALRQALDELVAVRPDAGFRVAPPGNLHITLKFLGAMSPHLIPELMAAMTHVAAQTAPLTLQLRGAGCFPTALWAGVEPAPALCGLAAALGREMSALGFAEETKPYTPHITLARLKLRHGEFAQSWCQRHADAVWGRIEVPQISLFRSDSIEHSAQLSHQTGVRYSIINSATLRG